MIPLKDGDKMPYGIHAGTKMVDVPAHYLIWIYENTDLYHEGLKAYIVNNMGTLKAQYANSKKK
jgi:uncharacterized protein (DUF3820 family)